MRYLFFLTALFACTTETGRVNNLDIPADIPRDSLLEYADYVPEGQEQILSRQRYFDQFQGFWLGQCIANWTGLITEMDKIGGEGKDGKGAGFYTRDNWGGPDEPNLWGSNNYSETIDFLVEFGALMMIRISNTFIKACFSATKTLF